MLSYQHKYHVGNHADVLKHLCWLAVIQYLNTKDKPYTLIDSHSGEGKYDRPHDADHECNAGVIDLINGQIDNPSDILKLYRKLLCSYIDHGVLPGSPALAAELMRTQDAMHCIELHPQAYTALRAFAEENKRTIHCHQRDAFEGLVALSPPKIKRGAILIDPPYENISEYAQVRKTSAELARKWSTCQLVIWVPMLGARAQQKSHAARQLIAHYQQAKDAGDNISMVELRLSEPTLEQGMYGSTIIVINPYWQFNEQIKAALPAVVNCLGTHWQWSVY